MRGERQIIWLSPVVDRYGVEVARRLESAGHAVTVVSPDMTDDGTAGRRLAAADRRLRLDELRGTGIRVVDWRPPVALDVAVIRAARGWRS
jgi:predicted CoA-binding protein